MKRNLKVLLSLSLLSILLFTAAYPAGVIFASEKNLKKTANAQIQQDEIAVDLSKKGDGFTSVLYDNTSGLPTSESNDIAETSDGFLWIGSYSGLIRYDGCTFERLATTAGISSVVSLYVDREQSLWIGTNDAGVTLLKKNGVWHFGKAEGLNSVCVRDIEGDREDNIYVATALGVYVIDKEHNIKAIKDSRLNQIIEELKCGKDGKVYGLTKSGDLFAINRGRVEKYLEADKLTIDTPNSLNTDPDKEGMLYIGTTGSKFYYGNFNKGLKDAQETETPGLEYINSVQKIDDTVFVLADNGVAVIEGGNYARMDNIPLSNSIENIHRDYQGNLWLTSSKEGLMKIVPCQFMDVFKQYKLEKQVVNSTCLYDGKLFVGCKNTGLLVLGSEGSVENVPVTHAETASGKRINCSNLVDYLNKVTIRSIVKDSQGRMWISTYGEKGLLRYDKGSLRAFTTEEGLPSERIRYVEECANGDFIVAGTGGVAVIRDDKVIKVYDQSDGIDDTEVLSVTQGFNGDILVGTDGDGIYVIGKKKIKHITISDGLQSEVIMRIKKGIKDPVYWVVTSNSLAYLTEDYKVNTIKNFPYSNNFDLYENSKGDAWVLSSNGLYVLPTQELIANKTLRPVFYGRDNGLLNIPNGNAYSELTEEGNLYIAGTTGVDKVNIEKTQEDVNSIKMTIPYMEADGKKIYPDEKGVFVLDSKVKRLTICSYVFTYSLINPQISYFLDGVDYSKTTIRRSELGPLDYTNLRGGNYEFVMDIRDAMGRDSHVFRFKIRKEKAIYEYAAFDLALILLGAAAVALIVYRVIKVTIISRQYEEVRAAKEEAERANSAKSRFLANMSHEIRTPINTIMGMDEMIIREDRENVPREYSDSIMGYAGNIKRASESLLNLVNDLLDLSKIESGKMHLISQDYETKEFLSAITMMIRVRSDEKDLYFNTDIDPNLPRILHGDSVKIKEVLLNLLTNAVKYTDKGGFTLRVKVKERSGSSCIIHYSVKDTGMGVKAEDMDRLFSAFERLDEHKNSGIQGTGLGLDLSRQFVNLMGGKLTCESVYGEGSDFFFEITQDVVDSTPIGQFKEEEQARQEVYVPKFWAPEARVLVVDDNKMNLQVIKGLLKGTKLPLTTALSGREALDLLKNESFHLILLDHMMPEMDGIETLQEIRKDYPDLPVIALTANVMSGGLDFYKKAGFQDYLAKPVEGAVLEETIKKYLPESLLMEPDVEFMENREEEKLPVEYGWLEKVEGINLKDGIKNCGGPKEFLGSLETFFETLRDNYQEILDAYQREDINLYTIKVHALKSSARIIGALELSEKARLLEDAGKEENLEYIRQHTDAMLQDYLSYFERLKGLEDVRKKQQDLKDPVDPEELADAKEALKEFIGQMDYDAVEMILQQTMEFKLPEEDEAVFSELTRLLKLLEWEKMSLLLK